MQVTKIKEGNALTVKLVGRLDSNTADGVAKELEGELVDTLESLIIDMEEVDYVSSKGVSLLVLTHKSMPEGAEFVLANTNNAVREVLHLSGLDRRFTVR